MSKFSSAIFAALAKVMSSGKHRFCYPLGRMMPSLSFSWFLGHSSVWPNLSPSFPPKTLKMGWNREGQERLRVKRIQLSLYYIKAGFFNLGVALISILTARDFLYEDSCCPQNFRSEPFRSCHPPSAPSSCVQWHILQNAKHSVPIAGVCFLGSR